MSERAGVMSAVGEGFRLIAGNPLSIIVWGVVYMALTLGPSAAYFAVAGPDLLKFYGGLAANPAAPPTLPAGMMAIAPLIQIVQIVIGIFTFSVLNGAIYRAVLRPDEKGFAYLRLGRDEFHLAVTIVVLYVLFIVAMIAALIGGGVVFGILAVSIGRNVIGGLVIGLLALALGVAAFFGVIALVVRFGMALPMTVATRKLCIFDGWKITKGHTWPLIGLALVQTVIIVFFEIVIVAAFFGIAGASLFRMGAGGLQTLLDSGKLLEQFGPALLVAGGLYLLLIFLLPPILAAPWAKAYKNIAGAFDADGLSVFE